MKQSRKLAALLVAAVLALGLTACKQEEPQAGFDAVTYVDGFIRGNYLGEFSPEYLEMVGLTEHDGEHLYEDSLYLEAQVFAYLYSIEYPDDFYEELQELYREIYTHLEYEVISSNLEEDGSYSVAVEIAPIDIVQRVEAKLDQVLEPFFEKYPAEVQNAMTTKDYQAFDAEWARLIIDIYRETLPETGNLERRSVTVKIDQDEKGYYTISDEEFQKLDALVIDYSVPVPIPDPEESSEPEGDAAPEESAEPGDPEASQDPEETPGPEGSPEPDPEVEETSEPGEDEPVPPTTASPLPEPEESGED